MVGGFGLKIGYPIGHIQIKTYDHTSTAQNLWSYYTTYKPGIKAMYHGCRATAGCSWWGMTVGRWPGYRNLAVVWDKEAMRGGDKLAIQHTQPWIQGHPGHRTKDLELLYAQSWPFVHLTADLIGMAWRLWTWGFQWPGFDPKHAHTTQKG